MEFFRRPKGGSRGGGPSISVGLADFFSEFAALRIEISRRQPIPLMRVLL